MGQGMCSKRIVRAIAFLAFFAVASMAYAYYYTHFPSCRPRPVLREAIQGCRSVKYAVEIALATDPRRSPCPSVSELIASHHLVTSYGSDPWGTPYIVQCNNDEVRVVSAGGDRVQGTEDDLRDNLKPAEIEHLERLYTQRARSE